MNVEVGVGSPAPDFQAPSSKGGETGIADYREQAHVVLFFVREYN